MNSLRKIALLCAVGLVLLLLQGCWVGSVYPYVQPSDVVKDESLNGTWTDSIGCSLTVENIERSNSYQLTYAPSPGHENDCIFAQRALLTADFFRVGSSRYMDVIQNANPDTMAANLHVLLKVVQTGDTLKLVPLNEEELKRGLAARRFGLGARYSDDERQDTVLTSKTVALWKFVVKNDGNKALFRQTDDFMVQLTFTRKPTAVRGD